MARKRSFNTFNLSFLDIMACGFGAVVLVFLMIDHAANVHSQQVNENLLSEVNMLEEQVAEGKENLVRIKNTIASVDQRMVEAQGRARRISERIETTRQEVAIFDRETLATVEQVAQLKADIESLEEEKKRLESEGEKKSGERVRQVIGDGDRQYLTGLKLGGNRILVLLDVSASMLDDTIVNIVRRRNMSDEVKINSLKWRRAKQTVGWLTSQFPPASWYQVYQFNTEARAVLAATDGEWLVARDREQLEQVIAALEGVIPNQGTSLEQAFAAVRRMTPKPDNILLITDGLPTQGGKLRGGTVSGKQRVKLFNQAVKTLPDGIPVNVILMPLEGDPMAASSFWKLAVATGGSFLSPSRDWP